MLMPDRSSWSVRLGPSAPATASEFVVLVPDGGDLDSGFEAVRTRLSDPRGLSVRLVGRGATVPDRWPPWLRRCAGSVTLTEIDAYLPGDRAPLLECITAKGKEYVARVFEGVLPGVDGGKAMWATFATRLLLSTYAAWPLVCGLAHHHSRDSILCVRPDWVGFDALRRLVASQGGVVDALPRRRSARLPFTLRLASSVVAMAVAATGLRSVEFLKERRSRIRLKELRASVNHRSVRAEPAIWIGVLGDWPYSCRHVIESLGPLVRARGERLGVILQGSLAAGRQAGSSLGPKSSREVFPTLDEPALSGIVSAVEQCVAAETLSSFLLNVAGSLRATFRAGARLARHGPRLDLGDMTIDLADAIPALSRLVTIDLLRAREALLATRTMVRARAWDGASIVWSHAGHANVTVPDLALQSAGANTFELVHGAFPDRVHVITYGHSNCTTRIAWSEAESACLAPVARHQRCVGGYVPRPLPPGRPPRKPDGPIRVLALTAYAHGFAPSVPDPRAFECYQRAFFEGLATAVDECGEVVDLRWRPHPSDHDEKVRATARAYPKLGISISHKIRPLQEDLEWADVLVSAWSSAVLEALWHPIPLLIHKIPLIEGSCVLAAFHPDRVFEGAHDLPLRFRACLAAVRSGGQATLRAEAVLRQHLFGPTGAAKPLSDLLWPPDAPLAPGQGGAFLTVRVG